MTLALLVGFAILDWGEKPLQSRAQIDRVLAGTKTILALKDEAGPYATSPNISEGGMRYAATPDGRISKPYGVDGGSLDLVKAEEASRNAPVSRVKVFLVPSVDAMQVLGKDGPSAYRRPIRGRMEKADIDAFYQELVRFAALAQVGLGSSARVEIDLQIDPTTYFCGGPEPFEGPELREYVSPRVNGAAFESDDKTSRGPYDLVVVAHAGINESRSGFSHWGMPVASMSALKRSLIAGQQGIAESLLALYANALCFTARRQGVADAAQLIQSDSPDTLPYYWSANGAHIADARLGINSAPFSRFTQPGQTYFDVERVSGVPWSQVSDNPWAKLKFLSGPEILIALNVTDSGYREVQDPKTGLSHGYFYVGDTKNQNPRPYRLDSVVDLQHENIGILKSEGVTHVWVSSRVASLVFSNWKGANQPQIMGSGVMADRPFIIAKVDGEITAKTEAELIGLASSSAPANPNASGFQTDGPRWGTSTREAMTDPIGGVCAQLKLVFPLYLGGMLIHDGQGAAGPMLEPGKGIRLRVKANDTGIWQIRLHLEGGERPVIKGLFKVQADQVGQWVNVDVSLNSPGTQATIKEVWIETSDDSNKLSPLTIRRAEIAIAAMEVVALANNLDQNLIPARPTTADLALLSSSDPINRAYFVAMAKEEHVAQVLALLDDPHDLVRLNACLYFTGVQHPPAEAKLADLSRWMDARVSEAACLALMHQQTVSGANHVRTTLEIGPSDDNRFFAAKILAPKQDTSLMSQFAALYGSRKWQLRQVAAAAIGQMKDRNAALLLMVFLQELDPNVRLTVTEVADIQYENVLRQLLYSSVNDSSEAVRAASYVRLAGAPTPQFANEGLKGVRDESWVVRTMVLRQWAQQKDEKFRGAFRQGVVDAVPEVKVAAIQGFAMLPGEVKLEEVQPALADKHPEVVRAVAELKKVKTIQ